MSWEIQVVQNCIYVLASFQTDEGAREAYFVLEDFSTEDGTGERDVDGRRGTRNYGKITMRADTKEDFMVILIPDENLNDLLNSNQRISQLSQQLLSFS